MKETIIIEQFDNGITIEATNDEGTGRRWNTRKNMKSGRRFGMRCVT